MLIKVFTFLSILWFILLTITYIKKRRQINEIISHLSQESKDESEESTIPPPMTDIDFWILNNTRKISRETKLKNDVNQKQKCTNVFLEITDAPDDPAICDKLGGAICEDVELKKISIPKTSEATFYTSGGVQLVPGSSYCVSREPPIHNYTYQCDPKWGYWIFSDKYDNWVCWSKVPGIYDSKTNSFNNICRNGQLLFDNKALENNDIRTKFAPDQFYSVAFQERFSCDCNKGYIYDGKRRCQKDPCLAGLPPFAAAKGYDDKTGNCVCEPFFRNINNDETFPCTACSYNSPHFNKDTNLLTIYIKCKKDESDYGIFDCQTEEEKIFGCMKAYLRVKPLSYKKLKENNNDNDNDGGYSFEERIFF